MSGDITALNSTVLGGVVSDTATFVTTNVGTIAALASAAVVIGGIGMLVRKALNLRRNA